jgi:hypothetical protein
VTHSQKVTEDGRTGNGFIVVSFKDLDEKEVLSVASLRGDLLDPLLLLVLHLRAVESN